MWGKALKQPMAEADEGRESWLRRRAVIMREFLQLLSLWMEAGARDLTNTPTMQVWRGNHHWQGDWEVSPRRGP